MAIDPNRANAPTASLPFAIHWCPGVIFLFWRPQIAVLDPHLEAIRMETSNQVVKGHVADAGSAMRQLKGFAKVLRAKKTFLTTLETFRGVRLSPGLQRPKQNVAKSPRHRQLFSAAAAFFVW